jgi:rhodanese-related sulfurtransferase
MDPAWLWWMLRYFGHEKSVILNGGWQKWVSESRNVTTTEAVHPGPSSGFRGNIHPEWIITADRLLELIGKPGTKLIDGRTRGEFEGNVEGWEHSYSDRRGRIPHAVHVLWRDILNSDGTFKSASELRSHFVSKGIFPDDRIISYCLGGMRSSANLFALYHAGYRNIVLYHGSWWDWGERHDLPLETGPVDSSGIDIQVHCVAVAHILPGLEGRVRARDQGTRSNAWHEGASRSERTRAGVRPDAETLTPAVEITGGYLNALKLELRHGTSGATLRTAAPADACRGPEPSLRRSNSRSAPGRCSITPSAPTLPGPRPTSLD